MGQTKSDIKNTFNSSFPDNYIIIETEEYSLNEHENNGIMFDCLRQRLSQDTFMQIQIRDGKIKKQKFKRKTEKLLKEINEKEERERERKEKENDIADIIEEMKNINENSNFHFEK